MLILIRKQVALAFYNRVESYIYSYKPHFPSIQPYTQVVTSRRRGKIISTCTLITQACKSPAGAPVPEEIMCKTR
jgi:hypothetical protein